MKRHLNTLFQRKRVEFEGASHLRPGEKLRSEPRVANLQANDGYDWLRQIKQAQPSRAARR